jgi:hypothetical protein
MMRASVVASVSWILVIGAVVCASSASAQTPPGDPEALRQEVEQLRKELAALKEQYETRLAALEAKLSLPVATPEQPPVPPAVTPDQPPTVPAVPDVQVPPGGSSARFFNPDMAVIGNFLGAAGKREIDPQPALEMHESEVSLQAIVDPYARADFFLGFSQEGVELEEGFITFPTLPGGLLVKAGRMRSAFGKVNTLHNHVLPWTDRPLAIENLLGGEEGLSDSGVSVARLLPNPWIFLEATGQVFRGNSEGIFESSKRGDLSYVGKLRAYRDITESTNIDLGASYARGHNAAGVVEGIDVGRHETQLYGLDATLRWKPLRRAIYHSFLGRSELVWSRREQPDGTQHSRGFYLTGDYQFARRWFAGARYDWANRADDDSLADRGQSLLLTFKPSEFSQVRGQYRRTRFAIGPTAHEMLIQFLFAIGAHGAHPF